jgi:hypothetical protein
VRPLFALTLIGFAVQAQALSLSPADVEAVIQSQGGRAAIQRFFLCDSRGEAAYAKVETGDRRWLAIAVRLLDDSDACVTTSLLSAIATALPKAPENVLPLVESKPALTPTKACLPFMSDEDDPTEQLRYLRQVEQKLEGVRNPTLQVQRNKCLKEVAEMKILVSRALTARSNGQRTKKASP